MQTPMCSSVTEPLAHPCYSTQLIDGDGTFKVAAAENFVKEVELDKCGFSYAIVSIIGPQSSGKSTLLNCLFGTDFLEMDALEGRSQTTKGIWLGKCANMEPCTLVLDLEGTDGQGRGRDDTTFEKQSALFALTISDIVLINMWCHDIGRDHAANRPLLETVFQVRMKLFTPHKITLLFVIRDKTRTPLDRLEKDLRKDIEKIWENATKSKPNAHNENPLSEFFNVEVVALSSYKKEEEQFKKEVASLRQQICDSIILRELAGDRCEIVHASDFSYSSQQIWEKIKADKDLDLPSHKVMVAIVRCEKIAMEKYETFAAKEEWHQLEKDMNCSPTPGFVNKINSQIDACLSEDEAETTYYDEGARSKYQNQLKEKLLQLFASAFALNHMRSRILDEFKYSFTKALNGGEEFSAAASNCIVSSMSHFGEACADVVIEKAKGQKIGAKKKLQHDIDAHVKSVLASSCQKKGRKGMERKGVDFGVFISFRWQRKQDDDIDDIEKTLEAELLDSSSSAIKDRSSKKFDPLFLASIKWEQVPSCRTLIEPRSCKKLRRQFIHETEPIISQAIKQQEIIKSEHKWSTFYKVASILASVVGGAAINTSLAR